MAESLGNLIVQVSTDLTNFNNGLKEAERTMQDSVGKINEYTNKIGTSIALVGGAVVGAMGLMINSATQYGEEIYTASKQTGMAAETLSKLRYVAEQSQSSFTGMTNGLRFLNKSIFEASQGMATYKLAFDDLGISIRDADGQLKSTEDAFLEVADKISALESETEKAGLAMRIFGRSGMELLPVINLGSKGIKELSDTAERLGIVLSQDNANAIGEFNDNVSSMRSALSGLWLELTGQILPSLDSFVHKITDALVAVRQWSEENGKLSRALTGFAGILGITLLSLGTFLITLSGIVNSIFRLSIFMPGLLPVIAGAGAAFAGWKLGKLIGDVTGLDDALSGKDGLFTNMFKWLDEKINPQWKEWIDKIKTAALLMNPLNWFKGAKPTAPVATAPTVPGGTITAPTIAEQLGFTPSSNPEMEKKIKAELDETLLERHARRLKELNEAYVEGRITVQAYLDRAAKLHADGIEMRQGDLRLMDEYFARYTENMTVLERHQLAIKDLDDAYDDNRITLAEYIDRMNELHSSGVEAAQQIKEAFEDLSRTLATIKDQATLDATTTVNSATSLLETIKNMNVTAMSAVFDFLNMSIQKMSTGLSTAISSIILRTKTASEAFKEFGKMMVASIVEFVVQMGVQALIAKTIGKLLVATVSAEASTLAAAWMPAALLASIATLGGADVAGTTGLITASAMSTGILGALIAATRGIGAASAGTVYAAAEGGIFTRPALTYIAEKEPEAAIPLSKLPFGNNVTVHMQVNAEISNDLDISDVAEKLGDRIEREMRRM